jgi:hypothetical protein
LSQEPVTAPEFCLEPYARGTGYWHTYDYQHPEYQHFTCDLFKNVAVDSIHETAHYKFGRQLAEANKEAEEQYIRIPRPTAKTPVLVVETTGVSTLLTDPTISPFITAQVIHSPQFTELCTHEETPSTDKPLSEQAKPEELSPEQEEHEKPNLEVHFKQALDIHKEPSPTCTTTYTTSTPISRTTNGPTSSTTCSTYHQTEGRTSKSVRWRLNQVQNL